MSGTEEFNFKAPQFVEVLANVEEADDGADNFFDAEENMTGKTNNESEGLKKSSRFTTTENLSENTNNKNLEHTHVFKPIKRPTSQPKPPPKPAPKPATVPQPFNLTDPNRFKKVHKAGSSEEESSTLTKNAPVPPKTAGKTQQKPVNVKKKNLAIEGDHLIVKENWAISGLKTLEKPNTRTKVVPFSFEQRNQERLKAKQQKLDEIKENKPDNFKAPARKPAPKTRASTASIEVVAKKTRQVRPSLQNQEVSEK